MDQKIAWHEVQAYWRKASALEWALFREEWRAQLMLTLGGMVLGVVAEKIVAPKFGNDVGNAILAGVVGAGVTHGVSCAIILYRSMKRAPALMLREKEQELKAATSRIRGAQVLVGATAKLRAGSATGYLGQHNNEPLRIHEVLITDLEVINQSKEHQVVLVSELIAPASFTGMKGCEPNENRIKPDSCRSMFLVWRVFTDSSVSKLDIETLNGMRIRVFDKMTPNKPPILIEAPGKGVL